MDNESALGRTTNLIASIEAHRQQIEKETGTEASRSYALRRLRQALLEAQEAAVASALTAEIGRVEALAAKPLSSARHPWREAQRGSGRARRRR